jgi:small subunit ribosomal protein S15
MAIQGEKKTQVIQEYRRGDKDTGSTEVQVALLTTRIRQLTGHLQEHKKDYAARRGLLMLVGRRSRLLKYLAASERQRYLDVIQKLGIRS